jgi:hypothetical protein
MSDDEFDKKLLSDLLGRDPDPSVAARFDELASRLRAEKDKLARQVVEGALSVEGYAHAVNELLTKAVPDLATLVGAEKARSVLGVQPGDKIVLLDTSVAKAEDKKSSSDDE